MMASDIPALILRLRDHERGARQQCTCRSDQPTCLMCDCGLAADEIERLADMSATAYERGQRDMQKRAADAVTFFGDIPTWQERSVVDNSRAAILALPIRKAATNV